jgi:hypothetical protein
VVKLFLINYFDGHMPLWKLFWFICLPWTCFTSMISFYARNPIGSIIYIVILFVVYALAMIVSLLIFDELHQCVKSYICIEGNAEGNWRYLHWGILAECYYCSISFYNFVFAHQETNIFKYIILHIILYIILLMHQEYGE